MRVHFLKRPLLSALQVPACRCGGRSYFCALTRIKFLFLLLLASPSIGHAADLPVPSGRFTFEGNPFIGTAVLTNTSITNRSLYLNGEYFNPHGYTAIFCPRTLDYQQFTTVVKLCPEDISHGTVLLAGGTAHRWFVLSTDKGGRVELSFNNHEFSHSVADLVVTHAQWLTLAFSLDIKARRALLYANGRLVDELKLPENFHLDIMQDAAKKESDKKLMFTDYSNGHTFRGRLAGLLIFDSILSPSQVSVLSPRNKRF